MRKRVLISLVVNMFHTTCLAQPAPVHWVRTFSVACLIPKPRFSAFLSVFDRLIAEGKLDEHHTSKLPLSTFPHSYTYHGLDIIVEISPVRPRTTGDPSSGNTSFEKLLDTAREHTLHPLYAPRQEIFVFRLNNETQTAFSESELSDLLEVFFCKPYLPVDTRDSPDKLGGTPPPDVPYNFDSPAIRRELGLDD